MSVVLPWLVIAALAVHFGAHVGLAVGLARRGTWGRAALAFVIPPLAPWWGWPAGMRHRVIAWGGALAVYAIGVALA